MGASSFNSRIILLNFTYKTVIVLVRVLQYMDIIIKVINQSNHGGSYMKTDSSKILVLEDLVKITVQAKAWCGRLITLAWRLKEENSQQL